MSNHFGRHALLAIGLVALGAACAHETDAQPGRVTITTAAAVTDDGALLEVARARCRRADECNRLGSGQKYADQRQCIQAYADVDANVRVIRSCQNGVDRASLDKCLAVLASQHCDADLGPVTAMPDCRSYCARGE